MKAPDLLPLAVDWLAETYPGSIIVTELSVADWGGALVDVGLEHRVSQGINSSWGEFFIHQAWVLMHIVY